MARRKEPSIPDAILDQLLAGADAKTAFDPGDEAADDIRDLRSLLGCMRLAKRTAMQTAVRLITTGILLALMAGIAIKLKLFGNGP